MKKNGNLWIGSALPWMLVSKTFALACSGCDVGYANHPCQHEWAHCEDWPGPTPLQGRQAPKVTFTGSLCGPCTVKNLYRTQDAFEDFVELLLITKALTS